MSVKSLPVSADVILAESDLLHLVCCRDKDRALCGLDASAMHWDSGDAGCVVCAAIEDSTACPYVGTCELYQ